MSGYGTSSASVHTADTSGNYVRVKNYKGETVKINGTNTIFNFKNGKDLAVNYSSLKSGYGAYDNARLKDGQKYDVDFGKITVTDKDGNTKTYKNLYFDEDGDGIADKFYKIKSLQDDKVKAHSVKIDSDYVEKKLAKIDNTDNVKRKQKRLEKLIKKMRKAGISEEIINKKLDLNPNPQVQISQPSSIETANVFRNDFVQRTKGMLPAFDKEKLEQEKSEKVVHYMNKYNEAMRNGSVSEAKELIADMAKLGLSEENKRYIASSSIYRSPIRAIELYEAQNGYNRALDNADFAKLDRVVEGLKHLPNYESIKSHYEKIKADAYRRGNC